MGNVYAVIGLIFLLVFTRFFINWYDIALSQMKETQNQRIGKYYVHQDQASQNTTVDYGVTYTNATPEITATNWWDLILKSRYENVPSWFVYMIYVPIIAGLIYLILPIPFKV